MEDVEGKVAFITGGASGIGLGTAKAMVEAGMKVVMADVNDQNIETALSHFEQSQQLQSVHAIKLDVTDREAYAKAAEESVAKFGKVHVLFNNAGFGVGGPIKTTTYNDWDWGLGVMIGGVVNGVHTFLPHILKHGEGGHILVTSSMSAVIPIPNSAVYITAKAAVIGLMETIRPELAPDNIGVSAFCPGPVRTNIMQGSMNRPEQFKNPEGAAPPPPRRPAPPPGAPEWGSTWMDNYECGQRILNGIRRNDFYILTHPEFEPGAREHYEAILSSFPREHINMERKESIPFLLGNQVFPDTIKSNKDNPVQWP